jgi:hypothetical protein
MVAQNRDFTPYTPIPGGTLVVTAANSTVAVCPPYSNSIALMQRNKLTPTYGPTDIWRPVGLSYVITADIAAAAAVVQIRKNAVAPNGPSATAAANGAATLPAAVASAACRYVPFSDYTFAAPDALGDYWTVLVTTVADTTGTLTVTVFFAMVTALGITDGVTL